MPREYKNIPSGYFSLRHIVDLSSKQLNTFLALEWSFPDVPLIACHNKEVAPSFLIGDDLFATSRTTFFNPTTEIGKSTSIYPCTYYFDIKKLNQHQAMSVNISNYSLKSHPSWLLIIQSLWEHQTLHRPIKTGKPNKFSYVQCTSNNRNQLPK